MEEVRLHMAIFLVELLTIELFNYSFPRSVGNQYWSIPLAFISCMTSQELAVKFPNKTLADDQSEMRSVLFQIQVVSLDMGFLKFRVNIF